MLPDIIDLWSFKYDTIHWILLSFRTLFVFLDFDFDGFDGFDGFVSFLLVGRGLAGLILLLSIVYVGIHGLIVGPNLLLKRKGL